MFLWPAYLIAGLIGLFVWAVTWFGRDVCRLRRYGDELHFEERRAIKIMIGVEIFTAIATSTVLAFWLGMLS